MSAVLETLPFVDVAAVVVGSSFAGRLVVEGQSASTWLPLLNWSDSVDCDADADDRLIFLIRPCSRSSFSSIASCLWLFYSETRSWSIVWLVKIEKIYRFRKRDMIVLLLDAAKDPIFQIIRISFDSWCICWTRTLFPALSSETRCRQRDICLWFGFFLFDNKKTDIK